MLPCLLLTEPPGAPRDTVWKALSKYVILCKVEGNGPRMGGRGAFRHVAPTPWACRGFLRASQWSRSEWALS